jgi:hypothetical protein
VDVDASLWAPRRPHANTRLPRDARGRDGGVRQELAEGMSQVRAPRPPQVADRRGPGLANAHWLAGVVTN